MWKNWAGRTILGVVLVVRRIPAEPSLLNPRFHPPNPPSFLRTMTVWGVHPKIPSFSLAIRNGLLYRYGALMHAHRHPLAAVFLSSRFLVLPQRHTPTKVTLRRHKTLQMVLHEYTRRQTYLSTLAAENLPSMSRPLRLEG